MHLKVRDKVVRRNIEVFKIILKRASHIAGSIEVQKKQQDFKAFIHRVRGEVRFVDLNAEPLEMHDWVVVTFHASLLEKEKGGLFFEISGPDGSLFSWDGFHPIALVTLKETMKTIQLMAKLLPTLQSFPAALREFSRLNLDSFLDQMSTKDLIHEAWHQVDRKAAERLLSYQEPGTFLFRQDEFASILEEQLSKAHQDHIRCITVTFIDPLYHIKDMTIVKKKEGWIIYNNDPLLEGRCYSSAKAILDQLKIFLKTPLLSAM